jgi:hypothetical protein
MAPQPCAWDIFDGDRLVMMVMPVKDRGAFTDDFEFVAMEHGVGTVVSVVSGRALVHEFVAGLTLGMRVVSYTLAELEQVWHE